jgi:hypothetical protein
MEADFSVVMPALVAGIHAFLVVLKTWMAGTSPAMTGTSGVDLTFATHFAAPSSSECQIQNSTSNLILLVVL